jgi:hypothetical protein
MRFRGPQALDRQISRVYEGRGPVLDPTESPWGTRTMPPVKGATAFRIQPPPRLRSAEDEPIPDKMYEEQGRRIPKSAGRSRGKTSAQANNRRTC